MVNIDDIAAEIRVLIDNGQIPIGERLPSERKLCEMLGVSRGYVRKALTKLELCGAIETRPQSGSYVAEHFFTSLVHTRLFLEAECIRLSALNRTEEDLAAMRKTMNAFAKNTSPEKHTEKDMAFHKAIACGGHNSVLVALLQLVSAEVVTYYHKYNVCMVADPKVVKEHEDLYNAIERADVDAALKALDVHLADIRKFSEKV
ncbi:MAG: FadR family transcriptional regulator [Bacteroidales bacterium]|nr:FadR family transcriptional regulator [Bacteroidales bacterium]